MSRMAEASEVRPMLSLDSMGGHATYYDRPDALSQQQIPPSTQVFEVHGAFFSGAAGRFGKRYSAACTTAHAGWCCA